MDVNNLKILCKAHGISISELAKQINMSVGGLYSSLSNNTLRVDKLELISKILNVSISEFFKDADIQSYKSISTSKIYLEIDKLEKRIRFESSRGFGLVYLEYDLEYNEFFTHFEPIKEELTTIQMMDIRMKCEEWSLRLYKESDQKLRKNQAKNQ